MDIFLSTFAYFDLFWSPEINDQKNPPIAPRVKCLSSVKFVYASVENKHLFVFVIQLFARTCGSIEDTSLLVIQLRKQTKNPDWTFTKRKALLEPHILNLGNPIATQTLIWVFVKYGWSPLSPLLWAVVRSEVTIFFEEFRA